MAQSVSNALRALSKGAEGHGFVAILEAAPMPQGRRKRGEFCREILAPTLGDLRLGGFPRVACCAVR